MCIHTAVYSSDQLFIDLRYILLELSWPSSIYIVCIYRKWIDICSRVRYIFSRPASNKHPDPLSVSNLYVVHTICGLDILFSKEKEEKSTGCYCCCCTPRMLPASRKSKEQWRKETEGNLIFNSMLHTTARSAQPIGSCWPSSLFL